MATRGVYFFVLFVTVVTGCSSSSPKSVPQVTTPESSTSTEYLVGPGDTLRIFVWRNEEFSATVPVRPDGKISTPLVEDLVAVGKTPSELARALEISLSKYIRSPVVTVIVTNFVGNPYQQIRVIGEAAQTQAIPYRQGMTLLDVLIAVGGLTEFAAGNRASVVRNHIGEKTTIPVRLEDLVRDGDIGANIDMMPGDILVIPQSWF